MRIFNRFQTQTADDGIDDRILNRRSSSDDFNLKESVDEDSLDAFWNNVEEDIHNDPEWFTFTD